MGLVSMLEGVPSRSIERGDAAEEGGAIGSISGDEGLERDVIAARSVKDWDRLRYVDEATLIGTDFGEPSRDFCFSEEVLPSDCSGVILPPD